MEGLLSKASDIFSELHNLALSSSFSTTAKQPSDVFGDYLVPIPPIQLARPHVAILIPDLVTAGAAFDVAQELSEIHASKCSQLADAYEEIYENICFQIYLSGIIQSAEEQTITFKRLQKIHRLYDRTVASWSTELVRSVTTQRPGKSDAKVKKSTFNSISLAKLKAFFQINPKPSHADKMYLAKSCNMTVKQINVWFQNRRARAKRERTTPGPRETENHSTMPYDRSSVDSNENMSDAETIVVEEGDGIRCCSRSSSVTLVDEDTQEIGIKTDSPGHAFPRKFVPKLREEAFPCTAGKFRFPAPVWRRLCTNTPRPQNTCPHITDLIEGMENLSLHSVNRPHEPLSKSSVPCSDEERRIFLAHINPYVVHPSSTPLPSLLHSADSGSSYKAINKSTDIRRRTIRHAC